ncbi:hypothetical protein [Micromonospora sagamiensis]|uniref:Uncharacterized protein n=1 Tax=Micromonospora sagamiensis TaxID=47875 RepID=A0A562WH16_9ACTN|nr:hypothetical protein [Micromonospora sagamiensis]TWJ29609.1 hypothetical protein JD81_03120 [Micromonospora sagamiensis]BCL17362.1 hypothetical protein GCM10017556_51010 [Micromonospora sagamiensis]
MNSAARKTARSTRSARIGLVVSELEKSVPARTKADPTSCAPGAMYCV